MKFGRGAGSVIAAFSIVGFSIACREEGRVRQSSLTLADSLARSPAAPDPDSWGPIPDLSCPSGGRLPDGATTGVRLYVDATESMRGYTGSPSERTEFDEVLARLAVDLHVTDAVLFGELPGQSLFESRPINREIHEPSTYRRLNNPDYCLFQAIERDSTPLHVYLTDGVQSASAYSIPSPSARRLTAWLKSGNAIAIMAFRGRFRGRGWSESLRLWIDGVDIANRPFYAFFLAESEDRLDASLEQLASVLQDRALVLRFRAKPVECSVLAAGPRRTSHDDPPWSLVHAAAQATMERQSGVVAVYRCRIDAEFPLESILARVRATFWSWEPDRLSFSGPRQPPLGTRFQSDSLQVDASGSVVYVQAVLPDAADSRFGFFELAVTGQPGQRRPSVEALTIDADTTPDSFDRTYRFGWLIDHLARVFLADGSQNMSYYLTAQYR